MKKRECHGHGRSSDPTYSKYQAMKGRCYNPANKSYARYGGRGIVVCERWRNSFAAFLEDMGPSPVGMSIERKDSNGNYEPDNCKWATKAEQSRNKGTNVRVEIDGMAFPTLKDASVHYGLAYGTVRVRTATYGWSVERALKTPIDRDKRPKVHR